MRGESFWCLVERIMLSCIGIFGFQNRRSGLCRKVGGRVLMRMVALFRILH